MKIDINLNENNELVLDDNSITTDNEFWQLRNKVINIFRKDTDFWNKFKNKTYKNKYSMEENIKQEMIKKFKEQSVTFEVFIVNNTANIFAIKKNLFLGTDELLIDFPIKL